MFPELRERLNRFFLAESEPLSLDLKDASVTFDPVNVAWYANNGYPQIYELLSGGGPSWSGETVSRESALRHPVIWACNGIVSGSIGFLPAILMQNVGGEKREAVNHPIFSALKYAPNEEMTSQHFRETLTSHCLLEGNGYARIIRRSGTGVAVGLELLIPEMVTPDHEKAGERRLVYVVKDGNAAERTYTVERDGKPHDILHIKGRGWDGLRGYSVIKMGRNSFGSLLAADRNAARFWAMGGRLPYVLQRDGHFKNDEDFQKFRLDWELIYAQPHRAPLLEDGLKYQQIGLNNKDSQSVEARQAQIAEGCRWFDVSPHMVGDLSRATFCLPGETEVYTEEGPRRIDQIRVGDKVWSRGGSGWILSVVSRSAHTGNDDILTFKTTNRTVRMNAKHRMLARVKRLVCVGAATGVVGKGQHPVKWATEWIQAGELSVGDTIVNLESLPDAGVDQIPSGRPATIEFLEFCGLLLGDGNVSTVKGEPVGVQIARGANASYMDHYRRAMRSMFVKQDGSPIFLQEQERQTRFKSVIVARELQFLGLCGNARSKRVPGWVFLLSAELRLAILRGFLDADGSVDKNGRASFSSCNREMLSQIRHLCMGLGIPVTNLRLQEGQTKLPNGRITVFRQYTFTCSDPTENLRVGSHTPSYMERMGAGKPFGRKSRNYPRYGGSDFNEPGCELARISSIERSIAPEPVYDLQVEETHSFIADGVVVHNSNIEHLFLQFVTMTLSQWLVRWEQEFWRCVLTPAEKKQGYYLKHNLNAILRGDFQARMAGYASALQNGHMSVDEVRELEDRNKLPDGAGEDHHIQLNMQTLPTPDQPVQASPSLVTLRGRNQQRGDEDE